MNQYLISFLIAIGSIPPAYFLAKVIFGKSIMVTVSVWTVGFTSICCFIYYIAGTIGISAQFWAVPLCFFIGIFVYLYLNKILKLPLARMIDKLKELSEGNLNTIITETNAKYELGLLNTSVKQLIENLNGVVSEVRKTAENLAKSSNDLNTNSRSLAESASEQASSVEEVSATMEQMAANIENNNSNANQTETIALNVSKGMQQVSRAAQESLDSVHAIADKISVINDIAFQTNI
jgi:methyl-accepting chemotaxis protein